MLAWCLFDWWSPLWALFQMFKQPPGFMCSWGTYLVNWSLNRQGSNWVSTSKLDTLFSVPSFTMFQLCLQITQTYLPVNFHMVGFPSHMFLIYRIFTNICPRYHHPKCRFIYHTWSIWAWFSNGFGIRPTTGGYTGACPSSQVLAPRCTRSRRFRRFRVRRDVKDRAPWIPLNMFEYIE